MSKVSQLNEQSLKINWTWSALKPADISSTVSRQCLTQFFEHPERVPAINLLKVWLQQIGLLTLADLEFFNHKLIYSKAERPVPTSNLKRITCSRPHQQAGAAWKSRCNILMTHYRGNAKSHYLRESGSDLRNVWQMEWSYRNALYITQPIIKS